jgi:hypothetical protein
MAEPDWPPASPAPWPTTAQLAELSSTVTWQLWEASYDLPRGRLTVEQELSVARTLAGLSRAFTAHAETRPRPTPPATEQDGRTP